MVRKMDGMGEGETRKGTRCWEGQSFAAEVRNGPKFGPLGHGLVGEDHGLWIKEMGEMLVVFKERGHMWRWSVQGVRQSSLLVLVVRLTHGRGV